ncbi:MAG: lactate racemase domain-containing protein [Candidatus Thorarchaeota archaeon]
MTEIVLTYGDEIVEDFVEDVWKINIKVLEPNKPSKDFKDLESKLDEVLREAPAGGKGLGDLIKEAYTEGSDVTILVDDNTRPNQHTKILLPMLIPRLQAFGIANDDIKILIAGGTHRPPTEEELSNKIFGLEFYKENKHRISVHSCDKGNVEVGVTKTGDPIKIDEKAARSCLLIPLTDTELHYFAGVAGTVKEIVPGIADRETVNRNHPKMFDRGLGFKPECRLANTEGNPVITEMKEIAQVVMKHVPIFGVDVIFSHGEIVYINAGDLLGLHNSAAPVIRKLRTVEVDQPGDLVIVGVGNLGINLYQTGKGLHAAWNAVRKDGRGKILALAPCTDGPGNEAYHKIMQSITGKPISEAMHHILDRFCSMETFRIGNQKPVDLLRILKDVGEGNIEMITEMDEKELLKTFRIAKIPYKGSIAKTLREYLRNFFLQRNGEDKLVYILPDPATYVKLAA